MSRTRPARSKRHVLIRTAPALLNQKAGPHASKRRRTLARIVQKEAKEEQR